ncbi:hypothetical protein [Sphingomonas hankyongi]|uniref:Uncharacterized protein n=1 Tax=Sphingomonas hankyongi TaxID=2908209 RepID=A0ABT0S0F1_9SPHN|nr:hypothetical protein [Sphingomonas hankyongi]MCL6729330.1 hypothetical protein [Sphingomonas hankyongi]
MIALDRIREAVVVALIAILVGLAVYSFLGFAWTVKTAVETTQKLRHSSPMR